MGGYEWIVTVGLLLLTAGLIPWGLRELYRGWKAQDLRRKKLGGLLLMAGVMCLLAGLFVLTRQSLFLVGTVAAGTAAMAYSVGVGLWANVRCH